MKHLLLQILDLVLPPRKTEERLRSVSFEEIASLLDEDGMLPYRESAVKALVWELKYHADAKAREIAGKILRDQLLAAASEELGAPLLIPIPMHYKRRRARGFNQTEILCESALQELGEDSIFEYRTDILTRVRNTIPQQGLPQYIRKTNVRNSMEVSEPKAVEGCACVVVDDVKTTGATLEEAKRALLLAGARSVQCISLARS